VSTKSSSGIEEDPFAMIPTSSAAELSKRESMPSKMPDCPPLFKLHFNCNRLLKHPHLPNSRLLAVFGGEEDSFIFISYQIHQKYKSINS
jgi:hypothetical protein